VAVRKIFPRASKALFYVSVALTLALAPDASGRGWREEVAALAGRGAVVVADSGGKVHLSLHEKTAFVPASVLKIFTAAAALDALGPDYRFQTVFRLTPGGDLLVSGRGDPHLVSEEVSRIAREIHSRGLREIRDILLDNSYFSPGLVLHGTNRSLNPYDAYNGALCVNFNTVKVRAGAKGKIESAEPQTPLTPLAVRSARECGLSGEFRINLSESPGRCLLYAGEILQAFLEEEGIRVAGESRTSDVDPSQCRELYTHSSSWTLGELVEKMFTYSNNFMANQIFLALGAARYGPPATAEKARAAVQAYLEKIGVTGVHVEEGSGLSRRTKITAGQMIGVLEHFRPYRRLLGCEQNACYKTGTLSDVKSMAGYLTPVNGDPYSFVILLNGRATSSATRKRLLSLLRDRFTGID